MDQISSGANKLAVKERLTYRGRVLRGLLAAIDPRAYLHLLRMVNYYNYTHVKPGERSSAARVRQSAPTLASPIPSGLKSAGMYPSGRDATSGRVLRAAVL